MSTPNNLFLICLTGGIGWAGPPVKGLYKVELRGALGNFQVLFPPLSVLRDPPIVIQRFPKGRGGGAVPGGVVGSAARLGVLHAPQVSPSGSILGLPPPRSGTWVISDCVARGPVTQVGRTRTCEYHV